MKRLIPFFMALMFFGCNVYASTDAQENTVEGSTFEADTSDDEDEGIVPYYAAINAHNQDLSISSSGTAVCTGTTTVFSGYKANTVVELQRKSNGAWSTIDSWSATGGTAASVDKSRSVSKGYSYRVKVTHKAINTSTGSTAEKLIEYDYADY